MESKDTKSQIQKFMDNRALTVKEGNVGNAVCQQMRELFFPHQFRVGFEMSDLQIAEGDRVAFIHALLRAVDEGTSQVRLTMCLRKIHGHWHITHEHHTSSV